ncbi:MAG: hypothetical protein COB69_04195 [Phycisphaera sp.]|nr:MAG: hypothetical protein COB69_04195 [Phycisphaera sp.]
MNQSHDEAVVELLIEQGTTLATVESCTGGMIGERLTAIPGSSAAYLGGFVTYSNEMKTRLVGVQQRTLKAHGAVSEETCTEMAIGGLERTGADYAISVTGIAGPAGGTPDKPIGTVWIGVAALDGKRDIRRFRFTGDRDQIRQHSATTAMAMLWGMLAKRGRLELFWETKQ